MEGIKQKRGVDNDGLHMNHSKKGLRGVAYLAGTTPLV